MAIQTVICGVLLAVLGHVFYHLAVVRYGDYQASCLNEPDRRKDSTDCK